MLDPILRRYEDRIDASSAKFAQGAKRVAGDVRKEAITAGGVAAGVVKRKVVEGVVDEMGKRGSMSAEQPHVAPHAPPAAPDAHAHAQ